MYVSYCEDCGMEGETNHLNKLNKSATAPNKQLI